MEKRFKMVTEGAAQTKTAENAAPKPNATPAKEEDKPKAETTSTPAAEAPKSDYFDNMDDDIPF